MRRLGARFGRRLGAQRSPGSTQEWPQSEGAQAWWDPRDTPNIVIATGVSSWTDRIGGYAVTNATGAQQPTINATGLNGKQALSFSRAASQRLAGAAALAALIDISAPFTILYIAQQTAGVSGQTRVVIGGGDGTHVNVLTCGAICGATDTNDRWRHGGTDYAGAGVFGTTRHVVSATYNGTTLVGRMDGVQTISQAMGASGVFNQLILGGLLVSGAAYVNFWDGLIGDVVVFTSALALSSVQAGEAWLTARYA